jgi:hypothetical protein
MKQLIEDYKRLREEYVSARKEMFAEVRRIALLQGFRFDVDKIIDEDTISLNQEGVWFFHPDTYNGNSFRCDETNVLIEYAWFGMTDEELLKEKERLGSERLREDKRRNMERIHGKLREIEQEAAIYKGLLEEAEREAGN